MYFKSHCQAKQLSPRIEEIYNSKFINKCSDLERLYIQKEMVVVAEAEYIKQFTLDHGEMNEMNGEGFFFIFVFFLFGSS